ncbi:MAG: TlpA family protein disulfide reductase [Phycisphaeraceae bacterium]|nr:TlpA family protein disulfide reductase [Phycisphaeraceae bacterium]
MSHSFPTRFSGLTSMRGVACALLSVALLPSVALAQGAPGGRGPRTPGSLQRGPEDPVAQPRFQLRLDQADRAALDRNIGFAMPPVPADGVEWIGSEPLSVEALRGRVVVIQSLTTRGSWRGSVDQLRTQLKDVSEVPVVFLLHVPEAADQGRRQLEPALDGWIGLIDSDGSFCDELGVWRRPVNLVVDRNGAVRYAGLTPEGVRAAVEHLNKETRESDAAPPPARPAGDARVEFPTFRDAVGSAADRRGTPMPEFVIESWITAQPTPGDRLVVIDFWATWCGPCIQAIPHMNQLADRFGADACIVGISNESKSKFEQGFRDRKLKERDFKYALAIDPQARLQGFFEVRGIPHCVVVSSDGVVRWQGGPNQLTNDVMQKLISANRELVKAKKSGSSPDRSWKRSAPPPRQGGGGRDVRQRY